MASCSWQQRWGHKDENCYCTSIFNSDAALFSSAFIAVTVIGVG